MVERIEPCPSNFWINFRLVPCSSMWVAKACLRLCGYIVFLIPALTTARFTIWRTEVVDKMEIKLPRPFAGVLCTGGEGNISYAGGTREIKKGDFFLQPFGVPWIEYNAYGRLSLIITMPPG